MTIPRNPARTPRSTKWVGRMLAMAEHWSQYSTCIRRKVGAVIYDPETYAIVSVGYNDTPIGETDCGNGGCVRCQQEAPKCGRCGGEGWDYEVNLLVTPETKEKFACPACDGLGYLRHGIHLDCNCVHAEMNAILLAAATGRATKGMHLACTLEPCSSCMKHLKQAGVVIAAYALSSADLKEQVNDNPT